MVTSICASCHVRFGKSKSSGPALSRPTSWRATICSRTFRSTSTLADDPKLNPADRHVLENIRDVVVYGNETMTCLSCHDVHTGSTKKHRDVPVVQSCLQCHEAGKPIKGHKTYEVHSERCQY